MWFKKKKCPFPRFPGFQFCPILEIENMETSESFRLLQFFIVWVAWERLKPFIEFQINRPHVLNILASNKDIVYKEALFILVSFSIT